MAEIRTKRLVIRRARRADLADIHAILSDSDAMRFWSTPPHDTVVQTSEWLDAMITAPDEISDDYVIERDSRVIGKAGCWRLPEIGYILHPSAWGQGLGQEALEAVIANIFTGRNIPEIVADVDPRNLASLRLLAKLGFMETGRAKRTLLVGDEWCDSVYLALSRADFAPGKGPAAR